MRKPLAARWSIRRASCSRSARSPRSRSRRSSGQRVMAIQGAIEGSHVERQPVEPLAHLLLGALNEGALTIAHADNPDRARRQVRAAMARLLGGLAPAGS